MPETRTVQVEFDERRFSALEREAARLKCDVSQVVYRACAAWISEMHDEGQILPAEQGMKAAEA